MMIDLLHLRDFLKKIKNSGYKLLEILDFILYIYIIKPTLEFRYHR